MTCIKPIIRLDLGYPITFMQSINYLIRITQKTYFFNLLLTNKQYNQPEKQNKCKYGIPLCLISNRETQMCDVVAE